MIKWADRIVPQITYKNIAVLLKSVTIDSHKQVVINRFWTYRKYSVHFLTFALVKPVDLLDIPLTEVMFVSSCALKLMNVFTLPSSQLKLYN